MIKMLSGNNKKKIQDFSCTHARAPAIAESIRCDKESYGIRKMC